jgi:hypothetical protein
MLRGDAFCADRMGRRFRLAVTIKPDQNTCVIKAPDSHKESCEPPK